MILIIYILFFFYLYKHYDNKNSRLTKLLSLLYLISAIGALYLYTFTEIHSDVKLSIIAILFHCIMYYIIFYAINIIEKGCKPLNSLYFSDKTYKILFYFLLTISIISLYDSFLSLQSINILDKDEIVERRFDMPTASKFITNNSFLAYLTGPSTVFTGLKIFLFFISFVRFKKYKKQGVVLLFCSLTAILHNLTISGRNAFALWLFLILFNYIYFKPYLSNSFIKKFKTISVILLPVFLIPTFIITFSRFAYYSNSIFDGLMDSFDSIVSYFSQGFINFSNFFTYFEEPKLFGKANFPMFFGHVELTRLNENTFTNASFDINVFASIIGSFLIDFGVIGTFFLVLLHLVLAKILLIFIKRDNTILSLILMFFCFEVLSMGVFYFMYFSPMFQKIFFLVLGLLIINNIKGQSIKKSTKFR